MLAAVYCGSSPAYWVALTMLGLFPGLTGVFSRDWWIYYGFAQGYSPRTILGGIGPAWTLGCEVVYYAALPLISWLFTRGARLTGRSVWWQLELVSLFLLASAGVLYDIVGSSHPRWPLLPFIGRFCWFALGMSLALLSVIAHRRQLPRHVLAKLSWIGWPIAVVAYVTLCRGLGLETGAGFIQRQSASQTVAVYALSGIVAVGLALPVIFEGRARSVVASALKARPMAWLGAVSYGIYLYHDPIVVYFNGKSFMAVADPTAKFAWLALATAGVTIVAAAVSYHTFERPILRRKRPPVSRATKHPDQARA